MYNPSILAKPIASAHTQPDDAADILPMCHEQAPAIPRYLHLAQAIHERFTAEGERQNAVMRNAEAIATRKNEVIMRAVQEVIDFCNVLCSSSEVMELLDQKAEDIAKQLFGDRAAYTSEDASILIQYEVPEYYASPYAPEKVALVGTDSAHLHISFNPMRFAVSDSLNDAAITTKHLFTRKYRITAEGTFTSYYDSNPTPLDPIADILTELRAKLGAEFFEEILLPRLTIFKREHQ